MHKIDLNKEKLCFIGKVVDRSTLRKENRKNTHTNTHIYIYMHVVRHIDLHAHRLNLYTPSTLKQVYT